LLFVIRYSLFVIRYSSFFIHYSLFIIHYSPSYIRQQRHKTGALYRLGELALVLGANTRMPRVYDFHLARNEPPD